VRGCRSSRLLGSEMRSAQSNQVRFMSSVDGVDSVIYRAVHGGKAAGGVDGCRLRARGADNDEKCSIPLHHLAHGFRRLGHWGREVCGGQRDHSRADEQ
jgi:hypothetical protein